MRKLTVNRKRAFVACACGVYIYIECAPNKADTTLDGVPCKNMGKVKNGKSITIDVPFGAFKAFVAYSKTQPQKYHTGFAVPAGENDVTLYTRPYYDPAMGNPFTLSDTKQ